MSSIEVTTASPAGSGHQLEHSPTPRRGAVLAFLAGVDTCLQGAPLRLSAQRALAASFADLATCEQSAVLRALDREAAGPSPRPGVTEVAATCETARTDAADPAARVAANAFVARYVAEMRGHEITRRAHQELVGDYAALGPSLQGSCLRLLESRAANEQSRSPRTPRPCTTGLDELIANLRLVPPRLRAG